ncbi:alpha/beta hydrolase [Halobacillus seohaensis]|uniref:Alpha/beta hydrolase n=1 Tax=Halobacillus seohaensis TaxID=447421 RepID=A0ABW2EJQ0_9BACI
MANLDPQSKLYLETFNQMPALHKMDPQTVREMMAQAPPVEVEMAPLAKTEDRMIDVGNGEEIKVKIYTPEGEGPFPVFVYYHGGGWVLGDIETSDASCRMLANKTSNIVVSVEYRLAPEHKFPVPVEDSYAALLWAHENAISFNGSASNIIVGGDSAGGNLATVVSMIARDQNGPKIEGQVLLYPVTSLEYDTDSYQEFKEGFGLDRDLMIWFGDHYISKEQDKRSQYAAPLASNHLENLPSTLIVTAENDVLRDEGVAYAEKLKKAGVKVETIREAGMVHGYFTTMAVFSDRIKGTITQINQFLSKNKQNV